MKKQIHPTIKAHLLRGAFYLLLLLAVCAIPFALAQSRSRGTKQSAKLAVNPNVAANAYLAQNAPPSSGAISAQALQNISMPNLPSVVLYDQLNSPSMFGASSQEFPDFPTYTDFTADDFVVPGGQAWSITEVDAQGLYFNGPGPADNFNIFFYQNNGGLPGTQVYSATAQSYVNNSGVFQITLTTPAVLTAGAYWISVQAHMTYSIAGEWGWTDRTAQSSSAAAWQNPGGGFGTPCTAWGVRTTCVGDPSAPDQVFRLIGTLGAPSPTPTATSTPTPTPTPTPVATPTARPRPSYPPRRTPSPRPTTPG